MNKVEIIKGIEATIEGLETIKRALGAEEMGAPVEAPAKATKTVGAKKAQKEATNPPAEETEGSAEVMTGNFDVEQLKSMKYNDFKKLAAQLGVKCTGTRDEIMERILALDVTVTGGEATVEEPAEQEEKKPAKSGKSIGGKKLAKAKADEPTSDEFDEQAEEIAKDTPVEDIIEALADVKIKATKKDAVVKLADALRRGLIELDAEEGEESGEEPADAENTDEEEIGADSYFPEYDPKGYNNPEKMSDERREAVEAKMDEVLTEISEGTLSDDDIASYIEDHATQAEIDLLEEDDSDEYIKLYMELVKRTIDNDGEEHEPADPYEVGEENMCCGHVLKYSKKNNKYICEHCGTEYEAE